MNLQLHRGLLLSVLVCCSLVVAGCSSFPREGPLAVEIEQQSVENDYVVVDVTSSVVRILSSFDPVGLSKRFAGAPVLAPSQTIGVGDELAVTIFEAGEGGLFSGENGNKAQFKSIVVNRRGQISIPYAGLISVKGRTTLQVQKRIVQRLKGKAIQPQTIVNIVKNENNLITVSGDVNKPGLYPIAVKGRRLLDIIAEAGGTKFPARETYVNFERNQTQGVQLLKTIIERPVENIFVSRGDRVYLTRNPQRYTVLGAVNQPGIYTFEAPRVNMLEAVASARGLNDLRADSTGLFVFRYENPQVLSKLGIEHGTPIRGHVPTIYRINMRHARSYFYAQSFLLKDKDSIFVSNAESVEVSKVLQLINQATGSVRNVSSTVSGLRRY